MILEIDNEYLDEVYGLLCLYIPFEPPAMKNGCSTRKRHPGIEKLLDQIQTELGKKEEL